jgi:S1-C subfamily serine protease
MKHILELEEGSRIERPLLGINHLNATDTYSLSRNGITLDDDITYGIVVVSVVDGSGAAKSSLEKGDVIIKVNDDKVINSAYLKYLLYKYRVDDTIQLT